MPFADGATETPAAPQGGTAETPAAPQGGAAETPAAPQGGAAETPAAPQGAQDIGGFMSLLDRPIVEAARDPIRVLADILGDQRLTDGQKKALFSLAQNRFRHRRRMAYGALFSLVVSLALLFLSSCFPTRIPIIANMTSALPLIIFIEGFLTTIVAAYFGMSSLRPSS